MKDISSAVSWILNFLFSGIGLYIFDKFMISKIQWDKIDLLSFFNKSIRISIIDLIVFLIFVLFGFIIIRKIKNKNNSIYGYNKVQRKLKQYNSETDLEKGIQYKWDVHFDFGGKSYISNLTPFCTKHGYVPLRMINDYDYYGKIFRCSLCDNRVDSGQMKFIKNAIESEIIKRYDDLK